MLTRLLRLTTSEVLLVKGPARVEAREAGVSTLGVPLAVGQHVLVRKNKTLPFESSEPSSSVVVSLGDAGDYSLSAGSVGTRLWREALNWLPSGNGRRRTVAIVLGEADSGKSTLTAFLANSGIRRGLRVGVVDGDVGQSDLGPPGSVGAAIITQPVFDLRQVVGETFGFVGATSPRGLEEAVVSEIGRQFTLLAQRGPDIILVNTDGYVRENGIHYKLRLIGELRPDVVLCLEEVQDTGLSLTVRRHAVDTQTIAVPSPEGVHKGPGERTERRLSQYLRFLRGARRLEVSLAALKLRFLGRVHQPMQGAVAPAGDQKAAWVDAVGNRIALRSGLEELIEVAGDRLQEVSFTTASFHGMFVGVGRDHQVAGFGLCNRLLPNSKVRLSTTSEAFDTLHASSIRLTPDLKEEYITPVVSYRG